MFNKFTNSINELAIINLMLEILFGEIGKSNQQMHQNWNWDILSDQSQQRFHNLSCKCGVLFQEWNGWGCVDNVSKESRSKVQAENMDFVVERFVQEIDNPIDHIMLDKFGDNSVLNRALLENSYTKSLCHTTIFLFFKDLDNFVNNGHFILIHQIFNTFQGWWNNRNEWGDGMSEGVVINIQYSKQEFEAIMLSDAKNIISDKLINQIFSQLRCNLQRIYSQRQ